MGSGMGTLTIRSSQKTFTEQEVSGLTGICLEHLRNLTRDKHSRRSGCGSGRDRGEMVLYALRFDGPHAGLPSL